MSSSRAEKIRQPKVLSTEGDVNASRRILKVNVAPGDVADVLKNTEARHTHVNKSQLDLITDGAHESRTDNPHHVTKAQVGLGDVQDGAEQNVQSDWNETDTDSDAYIQNKPDTISDSVILKVEDEDTRITEDGSIRATDLTMLIFHKAAELQDINSSGSGDIITDIERNNLNINTEHRDKTDNPHQVTKAQIGLGDVPNVDFTDAVNVNTDHRNITTGNPHQVTKSDIGLGNVQDGAEVNVQPDWNETDTNSDAFIQNKPDLSSVGEQNVQSDWNETNTGSDAYIQNKPDVITSAERNNIVTNTTHRSQTDNPHQVTKAQIGLGSVPNTDFTSEVNANTAHRNTTTGNPHQVTKSDIGLGNVQDGAEQNVQSDWNETNTGSDAFIQNKPDVITSAERTKLNSIETGAKNYPHSGEQAFTDTLAGKLNGIEYNAQANVQSDWSETDTGSDAYIKNKPDLSSVGEQNVQSDWHETDTSSDAYIQNKPDVITSAERNAISANTTHRETTSGNPHNVTKAEVGLGNVPNTNPNTLVSDEDYGPSWNGVTSIAPSKNAVYDQIESLGGGGSGLWTDMTSYYKPNNTNTFGLYDTGQIRLNNNGNQVLPGVNSTYNPYCLGTSDSFNIYDDTTTRGTAGMVVEKIVTTPLTKSDGSWYSDCRSDTQPGAALFLTYHTTNAVSGIYNVLTSDVHNIGGIYGVMPDATGIHNRVIKLPDTKNNVFGEWIFVERKPCTNVPVGGIIGAETNMFNTWNSIDSNRNKVYRTGVNNTHVYIQEFKNPVDNMYFGNNAIGWTINGVDSNGGTYGMMEAAIHIAPMQLTAVPAWANGILFSKHDSSPSDCYGPISPLIGTCINMVSALPKWGLKFGNVGAGGAHLYSTGDTIVQTGNGAKTFTLKADGVLEVPSVIRCTGTYGGTNHGTVLSLVNDTNNQLAFGFEYPYLTIYFNGTKVRKINTLDL